MKFLITGGSGFIGSALVRYLLNETCHEVMNMDCLTYASDTDSLQSVKNNDRYHFRQVDIRDFEQVYDCFETYQPDVVMHLAAETHVDRSIAFSSLFIQTNILGTYTLLEVSRDYWQRLPIARQDSFRFHHISTDEVYGDLGHSGKLFSEETPYAPSSPYSASKASSDHLVRAWFRTYGLPVLITNCSNNYGPYQFPEKLIPLVILNALSGKPLPIYGQGTQIRDWLFVEDHVRALYCVVLKGMIGETYNIGGHCERKNIDVVYAICDILDDIRPKTMLLNQQSSSYRHLITFTDDRPGHDQRYAIDAGKIERTLGWRPQETFASGLYKTITWYCTQSTLFVPNVSESVI